MLCLVRNRSTQVISGGRAEFTARATYGKQIWFLLARKDTEKQVTCERKRPLNEDVLRRRCATNAFYGDWVREIAIQAINFTLVYCWVTMWRHACIYARQNYVTLRIVRDAPFRHYSTIVPASKPAVSLQSKIRRYKYWISKLPSSVTPGNLQV